PAFLTSFLGPASRTLRISTAVPLGCWRGRKSACGRPLVTMARFSAPPPLENKALPDEIRHTPACAYLFEPGPDRSPPLNPHGHLLKLCPDASPTFAVANYFERNLTLGPV